ncbi:MAG: 4-hydroxy-tetrahydrodipicolinate synthase [Desulfatibacillaceae bacterium]
MLTGCYTALVTPFDDNGVDTGGLDALIEFQIAGGVDGILAVGTTGESPTLTWEEHNLVVRRVCERAGSRCRVIAGEGSNNTRETLEGTRSAAKAGAHAVLLVDPYYNGPSSLEIRREYVEPVAAEFPDMEVIPYIIPGRTGAQMFPEDLALAAERHGNVNTVKEATGDLDNMRRTRELCGPDFSILSGDDDKTMAMAKDGTIKGNGVISVLSNIAPAAVSQMVRHALAGRMDEAAELEAALKPLFGLVTVKTVEDTKFGKVVCRARNPLAVKTLMALLGMPGGRCRRPLGKMTGQGMDVVLTAARRVWDNNPEILRPLEEQFGIDVRERLYDEKAISALCYEGY